MIKLENQLALQFQIADFVDFISIQNFRGMEIIENAGGLRPIMELQFKLENMDMLPYLNQGNIITLMFGIKEPTSDVLQFQIDNDITTKHFQVGSEICLSCSFYKPSFTSKIKSKNYGILKSYEMLKILASQNQMKFISNVTKSSDKQQWTQEGVTDWTYLNFVAERAYKDSNTFFAYAFDNNNIYFYDVKEQIKMGPKWYLTVNNLGTNKHDNVVNIGTYQTDDSCAGTCSELAGKNVKTIGYNVDTGEFSYPSYNLKTLTTMDTNKLNINATDCENYNYMITSGKDHGNTLEALNQNKRNNILFSSFNVYVPVPHQYRDFKLLDCVQLIPKDKDKQAEGIYFITGIVRQIKNNMYQTNLVLSRESANGIKGENLVTGGQ